MNEFRVEMNIVLSVRIVYNANISAPFISIVRLSAFTDADKFRIANNISSVQTDLFAYVPIESTA